MKKVRLNESQLRRLVRGIIKEHDHYSSSRSAMYGLDDRHPDYNPRVEEIVSDQGAVSAIDYLADSISRDSFDSNIAASIENYLAWRGDVGMRSVFETAMEQLESESGDKDVARRALSSLSLKLDRLNRP